ncbi:MAG TPA: class I SAM-dependent methyltransferase [bacterium]|nr:class I SAM-dependent methyltransferase [bacterium]
MSTTQKTIKSYNENADRWRKQQEEGLIYHKYIEKPAMYSMLPNLKGSKILSIGVGTGEEVSELISRGAKVTAIDLSKSMLAIAKRENSEAEFHLMDMTKLKFDAESFDFVYSSLAIHYVEDWSVVYKEVKRVLKKGGEFLFSTTHPISESYSHESDNKFKRSLIGSIKEKKTGRRIIYGDYFKEGLQEADWGGDDFVVQFYHKTFESMTNGIIKSGLELIQIKEPKPRKSMKEVDLEKYNRYSRHPVFIIFKCRKVK